jgi:hypothetical protein
MQTNNINLARLRNEEHFQFNTEFKGLASNLDVKALNLFDAFSFYLPFYDQEEEALQLIRKSATTDQLAEADTVRDVTFRGFSDAVKSSLNHFNADKRTAAARFNVLLNQYGNVARKPFAEETAAIYKLVKEAQNAYASDISTLELKDWVEELDSKNKAFEALMASRYSEEANKTELRMNEVRINIDGAYHLFTERLDALVTINGVSAYESFLRELNARIDKYNNIIAQRKGRSEKDAARTKTENKTTSN